jgi:hypothetical protein
MPAPDTIFKQQTLVSCIDNGGLAIDQTQLDRGNVVVHANCCRTFNKSVQLSSLPGSRTLYLQGLTVPTCSDTAAGMKTYSSDTFGLCTATFRGSHSGSGTISGASFSGTATGTATGAVTGSYTINISGTFTGPGIGSFTGTVSGAFVGTVSGTINGGVVTSVNYVFTTPTGTAVGFSNGLNVTGGTFTFSGSFQGSTSSVNAYWVVEFSHCSVEGVVAKMFDAADDSLIAEYTNLAYCVKNSRVTLLNRKSVACPHPCVVVGARTQRTAYALHPLAICFSAGMVMGKCRGGNADDLYTAVLSGASPSLLSGFNGSDSASGGVNLSFSGSGSPPDFSVTGSLNGSSGVTAAFTGLSSGIYGGNCVVTFCGTASPTGGLTFAWRGEFNAPPISGTVNFTGGSLPGGWTQPNRPCTDISINWGGASGNNHATHDWCTSGDLVDVYVGRFLVTGRAQIDLNFGNPGPPFLVYQNFGIESSTNEGTVTLTISQSGDSYDAFN